jgi:hypothetical protein
MIEEILEVFVVEKHSLEGLYPYVRVWLPYTTIFFEDEEKAADYMNKVQGNNSKLRLRIVRYGTKAVSE